MKKRGFTLIELLAVIVVLAIIALIATPIVMNTIKNAQKGAAERSAERYVDAVETAIATDRLENDLIADGEYTVDADGNLVGSEDNLTVEVNGDIPAAGSKITIENGQVVSAGTSMTIGDYTVTIDSTGKATASEKGAVVALCIAATPTEQGLFDYEDTESMIPTVVGEQATEAAPYALGAEYTCTVGEGISKTFYVLKEDGDNVKLIMSENLGETVAWAESGDNSEGPVTASAYLASQTSEWKTLTSAGGTVSLVDAQDIADAMGDTSWNDANYTGTYGPDWMRANLDGANGPGAYWTSTAYSVNSYYAWVVVYDGSLDHGDVGRSAGLGVRPVITISKSNLSLQ